MTEADVKAVMEAARDAGISIWLDGGWGIDALLGQQHRIHDDVDVVVNSSNVDEWVRALSALGFTTAEDHLPTRLVLRSDDGRQVDVHPVTFDAEGTGWQAAASPDGSDCPYPADGFTKGTIGGSVVGCLTADLQVEHHLGYEPTSKDVGDLKLLAAAFGCVVPHRYTEG